MRSPPMRHTELHAEDETSKPDVKERRPAHNRGTALSDEGGRTPLDELCWHVRDNRDRRLRLLLRRYVNQIQYGCQNWHCAVPTCLSYRKRNSKSPLRHYTELSARTLACHLLDEYAQTGRDPSHGLCQSPPIAPWYEDPTNRPQRRHSTKSRRVKSEQVNGCTLDAARQPSVRENKPVSYNESVDGLTDISPGVARTGSVLDGVVSDSEPSATPAVSEQQTPRLEGEAVEKAFLRNEDPGTGEEQQHQAAAAAEKKDLSSFVQSVWDTLSLRRLAMRPSNLPDAHANSEFRSDSLTPMVESSMQMGPVDLQSLEDLECTNISTCGFALQKLSWKTLTWFVDVHNEDQITQGTPFQKFLRHNLFYNLSNPLRLYESVQSWNDDKDEHDQEKDDSAGRSDRQDNHGSDFDNDEGEPLRPAPSHDNQVDRKVTRHSFDINRSLEAFDMLATLSEGTDEVYDALHTAIQHCYTLGFPRKISRKQQEKTRLKSFKRSGGGMQPVQATSDNSARQTMDKTHVAEVFLSAIMASLMPLFSEDLADAGFDPIILGSVADLRNDNRAYPVVVYGSAVKETDSKDVHLRQLLTDIIDHFDDWHLLRLMTGVMDCLSHHLAATAIRRTRRSSLMSTKLPRNIIEIMLDRICNGLPAVESGAEIEFRAIIGLGIIELARSVLLKEWDREPIIERTGAVGGALELLAAIFRRNNSFYVGHSLFYMPFIAQAFDEMELPVQWQSFQSTGREMHILSFSFLFEPATLVKYFRSANVNTMRRAHEGAAAYTSDARQFLGSTIIPVYGDKEVLAALRPQMAKYFVLTIRRSNILEDAMNQLWRRQRREILRPLRVRLGKDEGEDGLDHGGVQQEFFRLVFAEAFRPDYGMFTVDSSTRMTWFQPGSLEPMYKFEALGILMSLAVYNAVTLPITFPLAFYRKLLGLKVKKLDHIRDGWSDLYKGLNTLLEFEGDVAEIISRTYEFSYEFSGSTVTIDMEKHGRDDPWPLVERASRKGKEKAKSATFELPVQLDITPPSQSPPIGPLSRTSSLKGISTPLSLESETLDEDAATVTNETREQYVKDYVFWLTDKSIRPQFEAFRHGFLTCLDPTALSMFTAEALRDVMEGHRDINVDELERTATYEEYEKQSDYIRVFWEVVRSFSPEQHRQLLEFVTASDRVPVNGLESIQFIVQKNGDDDTRLPSSSTCYGRLLLPQYRTRELLEEKLGKALENSLGFGAL